MARGFKKDVRKTVERRRNTSQPSLRDHAIKGASIQLTSAKSIPFMLPTAETAFKALLSARFCAAIWSHITDCDETFNYWEPMHYLVFGRGLQTWEYSPDYALRSYTYVLMHGVPAWIYHKLLQPNPMLIFYFIRCLLGLSCALVEVYFYKALSREFGIHISRLWLCFQLFSAGMFISSAAFLPSSFSMYFGTLALAAWWKKRNALAIFSTAISTLLGWPFAAIIGLPIAIDILFRQKKIFEFMKWSCISAVVLLVPILLIDSIYYGRLVLPPLNIVTYNVLTSHGPNLYGVEPWDFYFINGFLNYNFIWLLALLAPLLLVLSHWIVPAGGSATLWVPYWLSLAPLYLWLGVFLVQPHKEERFLFPIYPMISLCGAVSVDVLQKLLFRFIVWFKPKHTTGGHYLDHTFFITILVTVISSAFSVSRILALYNNFHAPLDLMMELNRLPVTHTLRDDTTYNLCVGKDWYRYPTSFFFPTNNFKLRFLKSEFTGILPSYYTEADNGTSLVHKHFNDQNREVHSSYFDITKCHFLLDLDLDYESDLEPSYFKNTKDWVIFKQLPFLNAAKSHRFFRAFYIPYVGNKYLQYGQFYLLQSAKFKLS